MSSLVAHEGIGTLLDAVRLMQDAGAPARALIVGDGPERTALQRQAADLGLNAIFTGRVPTARVRDYHAVLDVFVVPRNPDRVCQLVTPLKPVEAMASGLPVVVSAVHALGEIITDQETGMLVTPLDAAALADCLQQLTRQSWPAPGTGRERPGVGRAGPHLGAQRRPLPRRLPPP